MPVAENFPFTSVVAGKVLTTVVDPGRNSRTVSQGMVGRSVLLLGQN
jgi:hypothetical protein